MLRIFKHLSKKEVIFMVIAVAFVFCQVWLELKIPGYMAKITMAIQMPGSTISDILSSGGTMLLCALGSLVATVIIAVTASRISSGFTARIRSLLFDKVQSFTMEEMSNFSTAGLITRSTNDITQIQMLVVLGMQVIVKAPIMAVWGISKIAGKSWQWSFSTGTAIGLLIIVMATCVILALPKFRSLQDLTDNLNQVTRENLTGIRVVRAYNAESYQQEKFHKANTKLTDTNLYANRVMAFLMPSIQLVMNGLALAVYWIGAYIINKAAPMAKMVLFSDMVVYSSYAMLIIMSFMMLVMIFIMLPRSSVSIKRILEVLDTKASILDGDKLEGLENVKGTVEFRNVSFKYPDAEEHILHNVSFTANPGETVAFIGSTGSGKTTVVNLIPRFYDATEGQVLVDGVDVKEYNQAALRNKIGYVSQTATLFSGTIKSNLDYGDNGLPLPSQEEIDQAATVAEAKDFIDQIDQGMDGYVSQGGTNLSGGQKQRISIGRALLRKAEILIFDDSFSALDYKTDRKLRQSLKTYCKDTTKLIVAQRIGTIRDADKIVVLNDGQVEAIGNHHELMASCRVYQQIALSQLSEEELA